MTFRPYDTRQRRQVEFSTVETGHVRMYNCGPTVYGVSHIGNFRSFLFADLLRRYFEWRGYRVTQIMNITDVGHLTQDHMADQGGEDKLQKAARELGWDPFKVARHFEELFHRDRKRLRVKDAHLYPRATEHVREMLVLIQQLLDCGHAYIPEGSGEVYYDIQSFPAYGKLSGKLLDELIAGARVAVDERKRHPHDFFLWKTDPGHLMQWDPHENALWQGYAGGKPKLDSRIARGFPGWHIECSAMSMRYLGQTFDLHTGGEDNIFPHHECEIAQSEGATGKPFANFWMHARHLLVDSRKMAKSAGTLYRMEDLDKLGYASIEVRYFLLANHYRQPMNFTLEGLDASRASIERLNTCYRLLAERAEMHSAKTAGSVANTGGAAASETKALVDKMLADFGAALDDDLNTPNALAALFVFVNEVNRRALAGADARAAMDALASVNGVLDVIDTGAKTGLMTAADAENLLAGVPVNEAEANGLLAAAASGLDDAELRRLIALRFAARKAKNWTLSDRIRDGLKAAGVPIEDTKEGVRYTPKG